MMTDLGFFYSNGGESSVSPLEVQIDEEDEDQEEEEQEEDDDSTPDSDNSEKIDSFVNNDPELNGERKTNDWHKMSLNMSVNNFKPLVSKSWTGFNQMNGLPFQGFKQEKFENCEAFPFDENLSSQNNVDFHDQQKKKLESLGLNFRKIESFPQKKLNQSNDGILLGNLKKEMSQGLFGSNSHIGLELPQKSTLLNSNPMSNSTSKLPDFGFISRLSNSLNSRFGSSDSFQKSCDMSNQMKSLDSVKMVKVDQSNPALSTSLKLSNILSQSSSSVVDLTESQDEESYVGSFVTEMELSHFSEVEPMERLRLVRERTPKDGIRVEAKQYAVVGYLVEETSRWLCLWIDYGRVRLAANVCDGKESIDEKTAKVNVDIFFLKRGFSEPIDPEKKIEQDMWRELIKSIGVSLANLIKARSLFFIKFKKRQPKSNELKQSDFVDLTQIPDDRKRGLSDSQNRIFETKKLRTSSSQSITISEKNESEESEQFIEQLFENLKSKKLNAEMEGPKDLQLSLRSYQKQALAWMHEREKPPIRWEDQNLPPNWVMISADTGKKYFFNVETRETSWYPPICLEKEFYHISVRGGILADEMGMGKTIEVLSLILTNRPENLDSSEVDPSFSKTTLIVCPLSVLQQWTEEIKTHTPANLLKIYVYHGTNRSRNPEFLMQQDIVLTTFSTLAAEVPHVPKTKTKRPQRVVSGALLQVPWYRVVLDEAHTIKDRNTRTAKAAFSLNAQRRWCVTGTPIQNKLDDLFSLIHFLRVQPYGEYALWSRSIMKPIRMKEDKGFRRLMFMLQHILLRRTKDQKINNVPIVSLPPRIVKVRSINFTPEEEDFYQALWNSSKTAFNDFVNSGTVLQNYAHILELLLRLRQSCDHPHLVTKKNKNSHGTFQSIAKILSEASQVTPAVLAKIQSLVGNGIDYEDEECCLCLEVVENAMMSICGHIFCKSCIEPYKVEKTVECPICHQKFSSDSLIFIPRKVEDKLPLDNFNKLDWRSSSKIEALMQEIDSLPPEEDIKCIVFSQWTTMLDLVEVALKKADVEFVRLDGTMNQNHREKAIAEFRSNPSVKIFLISMKAGGLGLNLTVASRVYLLDPWWNPATEDQAIDRVHRLGQTKPVFITRFVIGGSIEDKILELQDHKKKLSQGTLGMNAKQVRQIRLEELRLLFNERSSNALTNSSSSQHH